MGITLGKKQLNKGRVSLYLNYSYNGKRRKEYLGIILDAPTSAERRAENRNKVLIARQIRAKKELEFLSVEYHLNDIGIHSMIYFQQIKAMFPISIF